MSTTPASLIRVLAGTAFALAVLAGCAGPAATTSSPPMATQTPAGTPVPSMTAPATSAPASDEAPDAAALTLRMAETDLGSILVDGNGMTLYMFTRDSANTSACEGQCLVNWPPLLGTPTAGEGVDDSKLGSFQRADGTTHATYNGWPLYYWVNDANPGDTTGQNVQGVWFVLDRDGEPIR